MYVFSNGIITSSSNGIISTSSSFFFGKAHHALKGVSTHNTKYFVTHSTIQSQESPRSEASLRDAQSVVQSRYGSHDVKQHVN